jgi:hypothetical protein
MAKKKTTATKVVEKVVEQPIQTVVAPKEVKTQKQSKPKWEIKDRVYYLKNNARPISKMIRSSNIFWFDEEKGYQRELKYCKNQQTCFVDEMKGDQRLSHIIFRAGALFVPKEETILQKMLSIYHPHKDKVFYEHKPAEVAESQIDVLELEIEALMLAKDLDIDMAEAVMRVELGSRVSKMSSKELKRDLLLYAKNNPELFLELVNDDNVQLRNFGIKATELNIIKLSPDQRHFMWGSNNRKLMTVPFDEHPYSALASWFKTDEGMEVYTNIEKQLT